MKFYCRTISFRILLFLLVWVIGFGALALPARAQDALGELLFEPTNVQIQVGDKFSTALVLNTNGSQVGGFGAKIYYDAQVIKAVRIEVGNTFPDYPAQQIDPETGFIDISGIVRSADQLFAGEAVVATIHWEAIRSGEAQVRLDFAPNKTNESNIAVLFGNGDILGKVNQVNVLVAQQTSNATATSVYESSVFGGSDGLLLLLIALVAVVNMGMVAYVSWNFNNRVAQLKAQQLNQPVAGQTSNNTSSTVPRQSPQAQTSK